MFIPYFHYYLTEIMDRMGYDVKSNYFNVDGICAGLSMMQIQAFLLGDMERFNQRLLVINSMIGEVLTDFSRAPTNDEWSRLVSVFFGENSNKIDLLAFLDGVALYFKMPKDISNISIPQREFEFAANIVLPSKLKAMGGFIIIHTFRCASNKDDLRLFWDMIDDAVRRHDIDASFKIGSLGGHSIVMNYHAKEKEWYLFNSNSPPDNRISKQHIANELLEAYKLCDTKGGNLIYEVTVITTPLPNHKKEANSLTPEEYNKKMVAFQEELIRVNEAYLATIDRRIANLTNDRSLTLLHVAVLTQDKHLAETLLRQKPNLNLRNNKSLTAFELACQNGDIEMVDIFLQNEPKVVETLSVDDKSALWIAIQKQNRVLFDRLVSSGIDVNHQAPNGRTALQVAASCEESKVNSEIIQSLIEQGANVNAIDDLHMSAITLALKSQNLTAVNLLLRNGVDLMAEFSVLDEDEAYIIEESTYADTENRFFHHRNPLIMAEWAAFYYNRPELLTVILNKILLPKAKVKNASLKEKQVIFLQNLSNIINKMSNRCILFLIELIDKDQSEYNELVTSSSTLPNFGVFSHASSSKELKSVFQKVMKILYAGFIQNNSNADPTLNNGEQDKLEKLFSLHLVSEDNTVKSAQNKGSQGN